MESFTKQELTYVAHALRISAGMSESRAQDPAFFSSREIFVKAAKEQRDLAQKAERMAKAMK